MKFLALLFLASLSLPALSQTCYVDMVHKPTGRVVRSFTGYGDSSCIEGMKECRKSIRLDYSSNPQYPNGSLDCVRDNGGYNPQPNPNPYPNPYPQPNPNPYPNPYPQPQPNPYRSVEVNQLILDLAGASYSSEIQTKIVEALVSRLQSYSLSSLVRVCSATRSWQENAACLIDGVRRAPREIADESSAIYAVGPACTITTSWQEEKSCFQASMRNNRLPSLGYLGQSCANMYSSESSARCYRSVFGIQ